MQKMLLIFFHFQYSNGCTKIHHSSSLFKKMHAVVTAVTIQPKEIVSNEFKDNEVLPEPSYGGGNVTDVSGDPIFT